MRRAAGVAVLVLVGALAIPIATASPVVGATDPTLGVTPSSGPAGTSISTNYFWDNADCVGTWNVADGSPIFLYWTPSGQQIGQGTISNAGGTGDCVATVPGQIPLNANPGLQGVNVIVGSGAGVENSGASAAFTVTVPTPPPTPTPKPTPKPTPRPTPTSTVPTVAPTATPKATPTPKPLPTPPPFIGGGGGGGSGGGSPEGGAACSAGLGRSPTPAELSGDVTQLVAGADPTSIQIDVLSSNEYYLDTGGNPMDYVNRLYDDVLRHDPTPVEVSIALNMLVDSGEVGRSELAQDVVLSPEARAIRVDQAFHTLLATYPSSADLAVWVNRLTGDGVTGISANTMIEQLAELPAFYALAGSTGISFVTKLDEALLSRAPTAGELTADAPLIAEINAGSAAARLAVAEKIVSSTEFLTLQVISIYANYMHPTCKALLAQECTTGVGTPTSQQLAAALTALAGTSNEEQVIAGVLGSTQYYTNHGSTQAGLVKAVYQDLLGRAPTDAELSAALGKYPNDPLGHSEFADSMTASSVYRDLVVSLFYQQLLLRAPLPTETSIGEGILGGDIPSLQTPDQTLVEQIVGTPEYLADTGGTPTDFVLHTIDILLLQMPSTAESLQYLNEPLPHTATWQSGVAESVITSTSYRTDFVRGVYAKFLTYTDCAKTTSVVSGPGDAGFLKAVPGGWFGLGVMVGVLLMGAGAAFFFTLERRRFARIYPDEVPRHHV